MILIAIAEVMRLCVVLCALVALVFAQTPGTRRLTWPEREHRSTAIELPFAASAAILSWHAVRNSDTDTKLQASRLASPRPAFSMPRYVANPHSRLLSLLPPYNGKT